MRVRGNASVSKALSRRYSVVSSQYLFRFRSHSFFTDFVEKKELMLFCFRVPESSTLFLFTDTDPFED